MDWSSIFWWSFAAVVLAGFWLSSIYNKYGTDGIIGLGAMVVLAGGAWIYISIGGDSAEQSSSATVSVLEERDKRIRKPSEPAYRATGTGRHCTTRKADMLLARNIALDLIRERLKAPASAKFESMWTAEIHAMDDCQFGLVSWVDAQNSFGAMIRTHFAAVVQYQVKGDKWVLLDLQTRE